MVNRHRMNWSSMSTSKYEMDPSRLDKDVQVNRERLERKKDHIKQLVEGTLTSDPVRQDETFSVFLEVLREWKETK